MYEAIDYRVEDNIGIITLNRPDDANGMDYQLLTDLRDVSFQVSTDPSIRAVILTGTGKFFSAGGDLKAIASQENRQAYVAQLAEFGSTAIANFQRMDAPLITAINGTASGGGFSLAISGDIAIASDKARFTLAYTKIGFVPDLGGTYFLVNMVGLRKAKELILLNEILNANQAKECGLVNRVVPHNELMAEAMTLARHFASGSTTAYGNAKRLLLDAGETNLEAVMAAEARGVAMAAGSEEGTKLVNKFFD